MRRLFLLAAMVAAMPGLAPASAQQRPASYTLTVTNEELIKIGNALGALPYRDVAALIAKLQAQVSEQEKPPPAEKKD
jgi:hypothetical protein